MDDDILNEEETERETTEQSEPTEHEEQPAGHASGEPEGPAAANVSTEDLAALARLYPGLALGSLQDLRRFGELRAMGLSVKEAFLATNADGPQGVAGASRAAGKEHLQSVAKKAGAHGGAQISDREMSAMREFFPEDEYSDKDVESLWIRVR